MMNIHYRAFQWVWVPATMSRTAEDMIEVGVPLVMYVNVSRIGWPAPEIQEGRLS